MNAEINGDRSNSIKIVIRIPMNLCICVFGIMNSIMIHCLDGHPKRLDKRLQAKYLVPPKLNFPDIPY